LTVTVVSADAAPTLIISNANAIKMHRHPLDIRASLNEIADLRQRLRRATA
jgi:hypothetical protein